MQDANGHDSTVETNSLFTFACGAIAGAALALMFAPARGRETREFLAQRSRRATEKGRELLDEQGGRLTAAVERGRETAREFSERMSHAVEQGKAGYRSAVRQGQELAKEAMNGAHDARQSARGATQPNATDSPY